MVLREGRYPSLAAMGLNDQVMSVRSVGRNSRISDNRYAPDPGRYDRDDRGRFDRVSTYDYRRRGNERLFEADVTSARAVVGPPEQRCWIEREQFVENRSNPNVGGALAGALIGGILGHEIVDGRNRDVATVGGAVAGAAVGSTIGNNGGGRSVYSQDVERCARVDRQARPDYWDVTYNFRGQGYRMQTTAAPGRTVTVNGDGEPRLQ